MSFLIPAVSPRAVCWDVAKPEQSRVTHLLGALWTGAVTHEKVERFTRELAKLPQVPAFKTEHELYGGMYARTMHIPAGVIAVGRTHKHDHYFMCVSGEAAICSEEGTRTFRAGDFIKSSAGVRRLGFAITDTILRTIHRTDCMSIDDLEDDLIDEDEICLYDFDNKLKSDCNLEIQR